MKSQPCKFVMNEISQPYIGPSMIRCCIAPSCIGEPCRSSQATAKPQGPIRVTWGNKQFLEEQRGAITTVAVGTSCPFPRTTQKTRTSISIVAPIHLGFRDIFVSPSALSLWGDYLPISLRSRQSRLTRLKVLGFGAGAYKRLGRAHCCSSPPPPTAAFQSITKLSGNKETKADLFAWTSPATPGLPSLRYERCQRLINLEQVQARSPSPSPPLPPL